ncbi:hypothetical protein BY458DRAFT_499318 [Sporodiniella umbellata]|nr:hypothetical protein BY458DRAFT_499318 [Sporodiniella umbellata]
MGKKKTPTPEKKVKASDASEIDDIFNTKKINAPKRKADDVDSERPSKQKKEENKESDEESEGEEEFEEKDFNKVEEVVFAELAAVKNSNKKRAPPPTINDTFGDSRGIKKTNRTTEEGYPLYDVKDLNIGLGKDTPECPFDCQCCF